MAELNHSCLHLLIARSHRLRRELLQSLCAGWQGPVERLHEPKQIQDILMAVDTPSLFGDATLHVIAASEAWLGRQAAMLKDYLGRPTSSGVVIIHADKVPQKGGLRQAAQKQQALHLAEEPANKQRDVESWLIGRLNQLDCQGASVVARALLFHRGLDLDALLAALDVLELHAGDEAISIDDVHAMIDGQAEEPLYKFADAFFNGDSRNAIALLHAGRGIGVQPAINALINETRKLLSAIEWSDAEDIALHAGMRYRLQDYAAKAIRRRALGMGKRCLLRLLTGIYQAQRELRSTVSDADRVLETLILNGSRVIRSMS